MAVGERHRSRRDLENEIGALRQRLGESEEILRAIRAGEVDAILVADDAGERILTVEGADSAFRVLVEAMNEGAAILRECGTLTYCNGRLAAMLKSPLELVMGQPLIEFIASPDRPAWRALLDRHHAAGCTGTVALLCTDGSTLPVQLSLSAMQVHGHQSVCLVATDLTEHIRTEEELRSLSLVDALTGLYNRRGFFTLAEQQLKLARRIDGQLQLVFADLDDLKLINDRLGHDEGDRALMDVAAILRTTFRESDTIARLGGDEFAILATCSLEMNPLTLALRLQEHLRAHNTTGHRSYALSMSVGIVTYDPESPTSITELLSRADAAMYQEKRAHHGTDGGNPPP